MAFQDYLFMIQRGVQQVKLDEEVAFFDNLPGELGLDEDVVKIMYTGKVDSPVAGVVAIVRFGSESNKTQTEPNIDDIEAFCQAVRDRVADHINKIMFDENGNVLTNGNGNVRTKIYPDIGLGIAHLTKWAHASMENVVAGLGLGSYGNNGSYDPDSDKNSYVIGNLEGGSGGKH